MATLLLFLPACLMALLDVLLATQVLGPRADAWGGAAAPVLGGAAISAAVAAFVFLPLGLGVRWVRGRQKRRMPTAALVFASGFWLFWAGGWLGLLVLLAPLPVDRILALQDLWLLGAPALGHG